MSAASPPALALTMEGLEVTEVVMNDRLHYGRLFTELWQEREGFILVEHDVVPWPGALAQLQECSEECCAFQYPSGGGAWAMSLGCIKFSDALVERIPYDVEWQNRVWDELDGAVFATLQEVEVHIHQPPVAHVKARTLVLRAP
jgi:hypothetical protein